MTDQDAAPFGEALYALGHAFNEPVSTERMEAYFDALRDLSLEQVNAATRLAFRHCKFFPKPVELRELVSSDGDAAEIAWGEVLREIRRVGYMGTPNFSDARTLHAVNQTWGSWRRLCETLPAEGPELVGWMKQFKQTHGAVGRVEAVKALTVGDMAPKVRAFIQGEQRKLS